MRPQKASILSLVLLYFASIANSSNIRTITFNRTHGHNRKLVHDFSHRKYAQDASWTYASCDFNNPSRCECYVVFETNKPDGRVYRETCRISPFVPKIEGDIRDYLRVFRFGRNKAIFGWLDMDDIHNFYTVHFPTCKIDKATLALDRVSFFSNDELINYGRVFAKNNDKYDMFYVNRTSDVGFSWFRLTLDEGSKIVEGPTEMEILPGHPANYLPVTFIEADLRSDMIGHSMITPNYQDPGKGTFWLLGDHSEKKEWMTFEQGFADIVFSTANNIIGMCRYYKTNRTLDCEQRNRRREKILRVDFETDDEILPHSHLMHNLRGGGFLMFVWPCSSHPHCKNERKLRVTKVNADGKRFRTLELMDYPANDERVRDGFFQNGNDEYCWYQLIVKDSMPWDRNSLGFTYEVTYVCFTDDHLSESYSL